MSAALFGCDRSASLSPDERARLSGVAPIKLTDANFQCEVIESELPVLVDMWTPWCQPCIAMKSTIREVAEDLADVMKVAELNIEDNRFTQQKYKIDKYPLLLVFVDGTETQRIVGLQSKDEVMDVLQVHTKDRSKAQR
ncbi:thioredoxin family protein [Bythopirellula goksoeyrii]|uniref:Thioredoxin n=1 Tax=Bythopirellula goksoeyrii TaxID=1400387 RepID=A0A5B9QDL2_9BACT|nr:thioredoxin domain-containing protein [Bythopirellula goksoeyrii]QEG35889.1 Thioredoxin [Bythopirellula goksoeyrii]